MEDILTAFIPTHKGRSNPDVFDSSKRGGTDPLLFPRILCGKHGDVKREWKKVCRKALRTGDWEIALKDVEFIPIEQTPGWFVLDGPSPLLREQGDCVLAYNVIIQMSDLVYEMYRKKKDRDEMFQIMAPLVISESTHFWFALSLLGGMPTLLPPADDYCDNPKPIARVLLANLLRWWPVFVELEDRFELWVPTDKKMPRWISWGGRALGLCYSWGRWRSSDDLDKLKAINDPHEAASLMSKWIDGENDQD